MTRYIRQSPLIKLNFDSELVVVVVEVAIGEPEKLARTVYTIRTPRNGKANEIPISNCMKTE
jgi:hypothetical protein